jgi:hypothetical protein
MKIKVLVSAAAVVMAVVLASSPVSAGAFVNGAVVVTPNPVELGGSVVISNAEDEASLCEPFTPVAVPTYPSEVWIDVVDPNEETIVSETITPDAEGNWSLEVTDLDTLGVYTVYAECEGVEQPDAVPAATPPFEYPVASFEVIAQATTTTADAGTSPTSAAATAAVTAAPAYTG